MYLFRLIVFVNLLGQRTIWDTNNMSKSLLFLTITDDSSFICNKVLTSVTTIAWSSPLSTIFFLLHLHFLKGILFNSQLSSTDLHFLLLITLYIYIDIVHTLLFYNDLCRFFSTQSDHDVVLIAFKRNNRLQSALFSKKIFNLLAISYLLRITTAMMTRITKITGTTNTVDTTATAGLPSSSFSAESQSCGNLIKSKRFKEDKSRSLEPICMRT